MKIEAPNKKDFTKVIDKMTRVVSNKNFGQRNVTLAQEKAIVNHLLEAGERLYLKIAIKGKTVPMRINILR